MAFYQVGSGIGVDLNNTSTSQGFGLGATIEGSDGTIWQYVTASTSVSQYAVVAINSSGTMAMASAADAIAGLSLAVAQSAFAANDYGWVPIHATGGDQNGIKVLCSGTMSGGNALYVASETGKISIQTSGTSTLKGITVFSASGSDVSTVTAMACVITWPKCRSFG